MGSIWIVEGVNPATGETKRLQVYADDATEAQARVCEMGLVAGSAYPIDDQVRVGEAVRAIVREAESKDYPPTWRMPDFSRAAWWFAVVLALCVIAYASTEPGTPSFKSRFQSDNAIGATANGVELLVESQRRLRVVIGASALAVIFAIQRRR